MKTAWEIFNGDIDSHPSVARELELECVADKTLGRCEHYSWGVCWTEGQAEILEAIVRNERAGRNWWDGVGTPGAHVVYQFESEPSDPEDCGTVIYVGMTRNLPARLRAHSRKWWWPMVSPDRSHFFVVPTRQFAAELESLKIHNHQPAMNRAGRILVTKFVEVPQ